MDRFNVPDTSQAMVNMLLYEKTEECKQLKEDIELMQIAFSKAQEKLAFLKDQFFLMTLSSSGERYITINNIYERTDKELFEKIVDYLGMDTKKEET